MGNNSYNELKARGFIYQETDAERASGLLENENVTFYVGFDPTGNSLHVGHLLPVMAMRRLQQAGHKPIVLIGGATALVGDPSGKSEARPIISKDEVSANVDALKRQLGHFISIADGDVAFVNNADWFCDMRYIDFLRDVGSRFSVNRMLATESVKQRLETGLSFLEFNYALLQAYDFYVLNKEYGCTMQMGGQDQWGNIVAGVDLVRRMSQSEAYGMTFPLLLDSNGQKFGKTAGGAVWLDPERTSVFDYYQFWRNCDDVDVGKLLAFFTSLPMAEVDELGLLQAPMINRAKEILAYEATALAHGRVEAEKTYLAACGKFGFADPEGRIQTSSEVASLKGSATVAKDSLPTYEVSREELSGEGGGLWIVKLFADSGLCASNSDARRLINGGGAYINDKRVGDMNYSVSADDFSDDCLLLKAGKKSVRRVLLV